MGEVINLAVLRNLRANWRAAGKKVVFTNGCFDIIHRGHIEYLTKAKGMGDILVVAVNTDASVRRFKGEKRPVVQEDDRAFVVSNLAPVDYVCLFDEDTPLETIRALVPDVLVKGADWNIDDVVGKGIVEEAGGIVRTIEFTPNKSTTSIIDRVLQRFSSE